MPHSHDRLSYVASLTLFWFTHTTEEAAPVTSNPINDIHGYDQGVDVEAVPLVHTYGTYGLGMYVTAVAWPGLLQVFTGGNSKLYDSVDRPTCTVIDDVRRLSKNFLTAHPVDMLVLGNVDVTLEKEWYERLPSRGALSPSLVVEYWEP